MNPNGEVPRAVIEKLAALQQRFNQLLAMLPTEPDPELLDPSKLADMELISAEMMVINDAQLAILDELDRCP